MAWYQACRFIYKLFDRDIPAISKKYIYIKH